MLQKNSSCEKVAAKIVVYLEKVAALKRSSSDKGAKSEYCFSEKLAFSNK